MGFSRGINLPLRKVLTWQDLEQGVLPKGGRRNPKKESRREGTKRYFRDLAT